MISWDTELTFSGKHTFDDGVVHDPDKNLWASQWDASELGDGQTIYIVETAWELDAVSDLRTCA